MSKVKQFEDYISVFIDAENDDRRKIILKSILNKFRSFKFGEWENIDLPPDDNRIINLKIEGFYDKIFKKYYYINDSGQVIKIFRPKGWQELPE